MKKAIILSLLSGLPAFSLQASQHNFDEILACHNVADAPGMAMRIEQSNNLVYSGAMGLANLDTKRKLKADDVFQIGSVTKIFTAAAILKLVEQEKLSLKDNLGKYIPNLNADYRDVTLERVLSHTAGLPDYLVNPEVTSIYDKFASLDQVVEAISKQALVAKPGEKYSYSNTGYVILGKVIEVSSGMPYSKYLKQTFFKPLNMKNTFVMTKGTELTEVKGYSSNDRHSDHFIKPEHSTVREWDVDRSWIAASGAIVSTLKDMTRWQQALHSGKVISNKHYQLMHSPAKLSNKSTIRYGLGTNVWSISGLKNYGHEGMVPGFFTWHIYFPSADLTATAFTNADTRHPGPALLDMIAVQLGLSPKKLNQKDAVTTASALVGRYQASETQVLTISMEKNALYSQYSGEAKRKLVPRAGNAYSYECSENYFQLREQNGVKEIVPIYLYQGEQAPMKKL